ncbi:hypothetical protein CKA32_006807 [Geitlerinema sp. FC II]|nr:hypothetical protein CKA32_006807 [Geitlerinema sp. FC II]
MKPVALAARSLRQFDLSNPPSVFREAGGFRSGIGNDPQPTDRKKEKGESDNSPRSCEWLSVKSVEIKKQRCDRDYSLR